MEKAYLSESEMAAMKDRRFYCLSFKTLKPGGCFTYRQIQQRTLRSAQILCSSVLCTVRQFHLEIFYTVCGGSRSRHLPITDVGPCTSL